MSSSNDSYKLFISYERKDAGGWAGIIYQKLKDHYGEGVVFKDEEETRTGEIWGPRLSRIVQNCDGFVLVIGSDWQESRMIDKLNDPENWVHKEIVTAVKANKAIFPVVVEGADLPDKGKIPDIIGQAIDRHHFRFRRKSTHWEHDLKQLCDDIEAKPGITVRRQIPGMKRTSPDYVLCRLNRSTEIGSAKQGFSNGRQLFLGRGKSKAGFRYFAHRFAYDVLAHSQGQETTRPRSLSWGQFYDHDDAQLRKTSLLEEVATSVFAVTQVPKGRDLEPWIKARIQKNEQPTVVYCQVNRKSLDLGSRIDEWFEIWRELLLEDRGQTIAVLLFVESGAWAWNLRRVKSSDNKGFVILPAFGKIWRTHLYDWLSSDVEKLDNITLKSELTKAGSRLYRFRWARRFDDISEKMRAVWR